MNMNNPEIIGTCLMSITSLLGAYYLLLKIRENLREKPDPKITYVTHAQMQQMREEFTEMNASHLQDLRLLRVEIRDEYKTMQKYYQRSLAETRDLISKNAQNISSLIAQCTSANQRISELSLKTDRIILKSKEG